MSEASKPVAILAGSGVIDVARMNRKSFNKSVESQRLWVVVDGGRVLPWQPTADVQSTDLALRDVRDEELLYVATLEGAAAAPSSPAASRDAGLAPATLVQLAEVIRARRQQLPENSYTSYLFREGPQKIRKKLGEEAIEVITAAGNAELVSESADLIYHLLVLLAAEEVTLDSVLTELTRRHK